MKEIIVKAGEEIVIKCEPVVKDKPVVKSDINEETIIPSSVAEYRGGFNLRNVFGDNNQFMHFSDVFKVEYSTGWKDKPSVKIVKANSIKDIKVGDLVRCTDNKDWTKEDDLKDYDLCLVTEIEGEKITYQWFNHEKCVKSSRVSFDYWKHWQVSKRIE